MKRIEVYQCKQLGDLEHKKRVICKIHFNLTEKGEPTAIRRAVKEILNVKRLPSVKVELLDREYKMRHYSASLSKTGEKIAEVLFYDVD